MKTSQCRVCRSASRFVFESLVLRKLTVSYFRCPNCGFLQTEQPYWLEESYSTAIAVTDTGLVARNLGIASRLAGLLCFCFDSQGAYLDIAGGYGLLTRLMRDIGFDFFWEDRFCANLLARGFDFSSRQSSVSVSAVTAFELLEHLESPLSFFEETFDRLGKVPVIFSTQLYSGDSAPPLDWIYYSFETGQHIGFFQRRTLQEIGNHFDMQLYSRGSIHMLHPAGPAPWKFHLLTGGFGLAGFVFAKLRMSSRTLADNALMTARLNSDPEV